MDNGREKDRPDTAREKEPDQDRRSHSETAQAWTERLSAYLELIGTEEKKA